MLCQKMFKLAAIVLVVGWLSSACNASVSPPVDSLLLVSEPFVEQKQGYTIRYPQGWAYRWEDYGDGVRFFQEGEADQQEFLSGPTVSIGVGPIDAFNELDPTADAQTILEFFLEEQWLRLNSDEERWVEKVESITVDGHDAAVATLGGIWDDTSFGARAVFVHTGDRGAVILGTAPSEAWEVFNPTFNDMLDSMTFIEPTDE